MRWLADLRYSLRTLPKTPGFTLIAILSIALGVGANSAMFSYVDAMLLRPLPVRDAGRVMQIASTAPGIRMGGVSYPDFADFRAQNHAFSAIVAYDLELMSVAESAAQVPKVTLGVLVSGDFFSGLGIDIPVGRAFRPEEDQVPGRDLVVVLSDMMWQRDFASDPAAVGRKMRINGSDFTIVGVAPPGFTGPKASLLSQFYLPLNAYPQALPTAKPGFLTARDQRPFNVLGKLKSGVTPDSARAEMKTIAARLAAQYPDADKDRGVIVATSVEVRYEEDPIDAQLIFLLSSITGLVLLIACANVANLLLARGSARVKEIAIRIAVGASRFTLLRQLLIESLVLAIAGGIAGLAVAWAAIRFLNSIPIPSDYPVVLDLRMDQRMLIFSLLLSIATGLIFGLIPAFRATRADLSRTIKSSDQGPSRFGFLSGRNFLVVAQLTLSVVLLMLSAVFVRGFAIASATPTGFRVDHTLFFSLDTSLGHLDEARSRQFYRALIDRLHATPGVQNASLSWTLPFSTNEQRRRGFLAEGDAAPAGKRLPQAWSNIVDENYFQLTEAPLLRGRAFDSRDTAQSPRVAVINEHLAAKMWPGDDGKGRDAIGKRFHLDDANGPLYTVIGITRDTRYIYWAEPQESFVWTAFAQEYNPHMVVEIRTSGDPAAFASAARDAVRSVDPGMPIFKTSTMQSFFDDRVMLGPRLLAQIITTIGLLGLLLAVIGLYGVVSYGVSRRTREIGIRMAIGARPADVLRMVLGQGMIFTAIGVVIGVSLALAAGGYLKDFVVGASPKDLSALLGVPMLLAAVMAAACLIPARRAARVEPTRALRQE